MIQIQFLVKYVKSHFCAVWPWNLKILNLLAQFLVLELLLFLPLIEFLFFFEYVCFHVS